jgi:hypothetical protein
MDLLGMRLVKTSGLQRNKRKDPKLNHELEGTDPNEVIARVDKPNARNPLVDASFSGSFAKADGTGRFTAH